MGTAANPSSTFLSGLPLASSCPSLCLFLLLCCSLPTLSILLQLPVDPSLQRYPIRSRSILNQHNQFLQQDPFSPFLVAQHSIEARAIGQYFVRDLELDGPVAAADAKVIFLSANPTRRQPLLVVLREPCSPSSHHTSTVIRRQTTLLLLARRPIP